MTTGSRPYVAQVPVPELRPGDVVIMDNLSSHERAAVRERIEVVGATPHLLPPYSPDFNPIERALARLKAMPRKADEPTVSALWELIGRLVAIFQPDECAQLLQLLRLRSRLNGNRSKSSVDSHAEPHADDTRLA